MSEVLPKHNGKTLRKVLRYIGKSKLLVPISLIFAFITVAFTLYIPLLVGDIIDIIGSESIDFDEIMALILRGGVLILLTALSQWIMSAVNNRIAYHTVRDIRNDAFKKIQKLPLSYLDSKPQGDVVNRVINDADTFTDGLLLGFTQLFTGILTIIGTMVFMFYVNWIIALVVILLTPISLFIAKFIATRTYNMFLLRSKTEAEATSMIDEYVGNQKVLKAFSHEDEAIRDFSKVNEDLRKNTLRAIFFSSLTNPVTRFVNSLVYAAVALTGAILAINSIKNGDPVGVAFTVGELTCLLSYANQYTKPFNEISGVIAEFQNALACASRVFDLVEEKSESDDSELPDLKVGKDSITLSDVEFSYSKDKPLIEGFNLIVPYGKRVAIVGPTGCGKTTLINLLMRFYDVNSGSISVDGQDVREVTRRSLRNNYGMVLQDTWLMSGTVRDNIVMGKPDASDEDIIKAAKASHAHSFIKRLKNGYNTVIGEGGEGLSQGQKQLLCITRIMLSLPPVLILDEATSSIDTRTEMKIQKAFSEMMRGRTSFIVAHRLSTVKEADVILVMKDGKIIESGTHFELLSRGGFYKELYESQFAH